eukprot:778109-Alexandrium_andersonii.AAC.1
MCPPHAQEWPNHAKSVKRWVCVLPARGATYSTWTQQCLLYHVFSARRMLMCVNISKLADTPHAWTGGPDIGCHPA